ncbi:MAG TPA: FG-GAP-like repeat-containing protein [Rhodothermales bacterium]|nr:FG-GAP-like repeat-containing protein [Rhodothermales bacterium]
MTKQLSRLSLVCLLMVPFLGSITFMPNTAQAQFEPVTDASVEVAWTLDPRDFPDLFDHPNENGAFGTRGVLSGMDFDGDGNKEFLFATDETLAPGGPDPGFLDIFLYENNGDDSYEHVWHYTHTMASNSLPPLAYGDIDDDGLWEIYFGVPTLPSTGEVDDLFIFEQNEDGTFPVEPTVAYGYERAVDADFRPSGLQVVDVDGDGQKELLTLSRTSNNRELVVIAPDAGIDAFATFTIEFEAGNDILMGGSVYDLSVVDFDGDGNNEIWVNTWDLLSLSIFEVTGPDSYELQADINQVTPDIDHGSQNVHDLLFYDLDNDGELELIFPTTNAELYIIENTDDVSTLTGDSFIDVGYFIPADVASGRHDDNGRGADLGDLDGNGKIDIILSGYRSERIYRAEYNGSGSITDSTSYTWTTILNSDAGDDEPLEQYYPLTITDDLDGDGFNEIIITNRGASETDQPIIVILESTGVQTDIEENETPSSFALKQNYPNPFNPSTTIEYELPATATVSVRVYNLMGQVVRTLVSGQIQTLGRHSVTWNGRSDAGTPVASGTYLYSLEFNGTIQTRPMTLIK